MADEIAVERGAGAGWALARTLDEICDGNRKAIEAAIAALTLFLEKA
jgi:hypothetical protein